MLSRQLHVKSEMADCNCRIIDFLRKLRPKRMLTRISRRSSKQQEIAIVLTIQENYSASATVLSNEWTHHRSRGLDGMGFKISDYRFVTRSGTNAEAQIRTQI
jgi:hypothetical protein